MSKQKRFHAYFCHPFEGGDGDQLGNISRSAKVANECQTILNNNLCQYNIELFLFCPTLYFPMWHLQTPKSRTHWMHQCLAWIPKCDFVLVGSEMISKGMKDEIEHAKHFNIPVFDRYSDVETHILDIAHSGDVESVYKRLGIMTRKIGQ